MFCNYTRRRAGLPLRNCTLPLNRRRCRSAVEPHQAAAIRRRDITERSSEFATSGTVHQESGINCATSAAECRFGTSCLSFFFFFFFFFYNSDVTDSTAFELKRRSRGQGMGIRSHVLNAKDEKCGSSGQCWRWRGQSNRSAVRAWLQPLRYLCCSTASQSSRSSTITVSPKMPARFSAVIPTSFFA